VKLHKRVRGAIEQIPEEQWRPLADYPETGEAEIAETTLGPWRLIVRRVLSPRRARARVCAAA
jgi:hypothetical protein